MKNGMLFFAVLALNAQLPTGAITGLIRDQSDAPIAGARIHVVNLATNETRTATTSRQGDYTLSSLAPGEYKITVEANPFPRLDRSAIVEAGVTTTADFDLRLGDLKESITVQATSPQIRYDSYSVGNVISGREMENLPLNGRNFLELAKLEPGVQPPSHAPGNQTMIAVLGGPGGVSGRGTRVTIDGGSVMSVGVFASVMGFSRDVVQEFQISTVNYDVSTGLTFTGAINVVTRSGSNDLHGSGFYYFRDHNLSAYPALKRNSENPDPFFQRRQFGFAAGGPIRRDRLFFFANWERTDQRGVGTTTVFGPDFGGLSRITSSPLFGNQLSFRLDDRLSSRHTAFVRYSHDGGHSFTDTSGAPTGLPNTYPSSWVRELTWVDQSLLGITSILRPTLVNDLRLSYFFYSDDQLPAAQSDCPGCIGIGAPAISIPQVSLTIGQSSLGILLYPGRRFHLNDSLAWQRGAHRARLGFDWEFNRGGALAWNNEPASLVLFAPNQVRTYNQSLNDPNLRIPLPSAFHTLQDILQLPLQSVTIGIGDPRTRQENGSQVRSWSTVRLYFQDAWRWRQRLTLNYGLAWMVDGFKNYDLTKPGYLAPILGAGGLGPTRKNWKNFSPALGFAWALSQHKKTVIHAGAGMYYDFFFQGQIDTERALLGPPTSGRQTILGSAIGNPLTTVPGVDFGTPLSFSGNPTRFTGADLLSVLPAIRAQLASNLANADRSLTSVQILKQVAGQANILFPANVPSWSAQHVNVGVQRELATDFVLTADFVFRHFIHGGMGISGLDLNHSNSVRGPVIPSCKDNERYDPHALCSTGPIQVWESSSNQMYKGLLLRADKRFSHHFQTLASYAWSSNVGTPGSGAANPVAAPGASGLDLDHWHQPSRPIRIDYTHILNIALVAQLPRHFNLGLNFSCSSAPPFSPFVGGIDFNGDGTKGDLLPGTSLGQFNRGLGRDDLVRLVNRFDQNYALTADTHGVIIPPITLPSSYALDHAFQALDLRLGKDFILREHWRVSLIGEVFNLYNAANLSGYSPDLTSPAFGQPTARFTQLFGSGGPRAFQLATRVSF